MLNSPHAALVPNHPWPIRRGIVVDGAWQARKLTVGGGQPAVFAPPRLPGCMPRPVKMSCHLPLHLAAVVAVREADIRAHWVAARAQAIRAVWLDAWGDSRLGPHQSRTLFDERSPNVIDNTGPHLDDSHNVI